jgi:tetratricopeptide (TPR) repeat protein
LKALGRLDEALSEYDAIAREFPHNVVARTGRAEVLKAPGRLDETLWECDVTARKFPYNVVARTGRAEELKGLGHLDEALSEYDAIAREFPHSVVAHNGRAEVLKALGRLDEALSEYEATARGFPHDVVARNGRAEVLKALGRLDEALSDYEATAREFPHDVVARTGRAEALKALGRLDEALSEYEAITREFPHNVVARVGRASVLVLMGRFEDALRLLPEQPPKTADDWIAFHIRGMVALRTGEVSSAIRMFEFGLRENRWYDTRRYFRGPLAAARLRRSEFSDAVEALADEPASVCQVLRIHAFGGLGETGKAREALSRIETIRLPTLTTLRDELAARYVPEHERRSLHSDEWVLDRECELVLVAWPEEAADIRTVST